MYRRLFLQSPGNTNGVICIAAVLRGQTGNPRHPSFQTGHSGRHWICNSCVTSWVAIKHRLGVGG